MIVLHRQKPDGALYVEPDAILAITGEPNGSKVFISGASFDVRETPDQIATLLNWEGFTPREFNHVPGPSPTNDR
jgi:hypothetical protein